MISSSLANMEGVEVEIVRSSEPVICTVVPGFDTAVEAYFTG